MMQDHYFWRDTALRYINENCQSSGIERFQKRDYPHYVLQAKIFSLLKDYGFFIRHDPKVSSVIRKDHFVGEKDGLKLKAERFPNGFELMFYQEHRYTNPNGGAYDFEKEEKMPYLIHLSYLCTKKRIQNFLDTVDAKNETDPGLFTKYAEEKVRCDYAKSWYHPQKSSDFNLSELDGADYDIPGEPFRTNGFDRDRKTIKNGDMKYFRDHDGYLKRGKVYHNINNMWWVIVDKYTLRNIACFELFDAAEEDFCHRRKQPDRKPEERKELESALTLASSKDLFNELKRRGIRLRTA